MTTLEQAARDALDVLEQLQGGCTDHDDGTVEAITVWCPEVIVSLRAALAAGQAQPVAWVRAIDEAMVTHHIGTADPSDDYETAKHKLNTLFCHAQSIGEYFAKQEAAPPAQPLTDEQIMDIPAGVNDGSQSFLLRFARAIEHAHGIGAQA